MNNNTNTNIFFYSANCKFCYNLMKLLNNMSILKNFMLIQTDNNPNLPPQITAVPTLVVAGLPKMLVCNEAFKWVNGLMQIKNNQSQVAMKNQKNIFIMSELMNKNKGKNDPYGADKVNFSDLFTFVDNDNVPQTHNFTDPTKKLSHMFTAPEMKKKMNEKEQLDQVNEKLAKREEQDKYFKEYMKQFHDEETLQKYNVETKNDINKRRQEEMKKKLIMRQILMKKKQLMMQKMQQNRMMNDGGIY